MGIHEDYLDTFPGLVVNFVMDEMRKFDHAETSWELLPDEQKQDRLDAIAVRADELSQKLVDAVLAEGSHVVRGTIDQVVFKKGAKGRGAVFPARGTPPRPRRRGRTVRPADDPATGPRSTG